MMHEYTGGFQEIQHTADLEIRVWASSLEGLFIQAARGLYHLVKLTPVDDPHTPVARVITLEAYDRESLLISFLNELLFFLEDEDLYFPQLHIELVQGTHLKADLEGIPVENQLRDIKAVTFHQVKIREEDDQLTVNIVFDI